MKPLIHFAHANGVPSKVYQKLFDGLQDDYDIIYVPLLGPDKRYPIDNHWNGLTQQVIDSIVRQAKGRKVIGLGHSLGAALTFMASYKRPELFDQVIMLDPPLILGKASFVLHWAKQLHPQWVDRTTPAGLSAKRRDHWDSREQAYQLLRSKGFYKAFDESCFQAYMQDALVDDPVRGGVCLTIAKQDEVDIFRTNPSWWWLKPRHAPCVPVQQIIGQDSIFLKNKFPQLAKKQWNIPFSVIQGGHMFPLEYPHETVKLLKTKIKAVDIS